VTEELSHIERTHNHVRCISMTWNTVERADAVYLTIQVHLIVIPYWSLFL